MTESGAAYPPPLFANHDPQLGTLNILEAAKQRLWPESGPGWGRGMGLCPCIHPTSGVYARALIPRHRKCSLARKVVSNQWPATPGKSVPINF